MQEHLAFTDCLVIAVRCKKIKSKSEMAFPTFHWWLHRDNLSHQKSNKGFSLLLCRRQSTTWHVLRRAEPQTIPRTGDAARTLRRVLPPWGLEPVPTDKVWHLPLRPREGNWFIWISKAPYYDHGNCRLDNHGLARLCWLPGVLPKDILSQLDPDKWLGIHRPACQETMSAFICKHFGVP